MMQTTTTLTAGLLLGSVLGASGFVERVPPTFARASTAMLADVEMASATEVVTQEDEAFMERLPRLCQERNLPFEKIKNARDLASADGSPVVAGRVFRCGRFGDATDADMNILNGIDFKTLVDLRSPTELKDDPSVMRNEVFGDYTNIVWKEQGRDKDGCLKELKDGEFPVKKRRTALWRKLKESLKNVDFDDGADEEQPESVDDFCVSCDDPDSISAAALLAKGKDRKERHFVSLMNEFKYVKGTVSKVRKRDITKGILKSPGAIFSSRVRSSIKKPFLDEINGGGLPMLNELLLRYGAPGIKYVLELCANTDRHPIAFFCTAGKDRTGMVAAIILSLCGVGVDAIVEDYAMSANVYAEMADHSAMVGALSQRSLDPNVFLGAPPHVMREILIEIERDYGSVEGYCDWIGFGPEKQEQLRKAMMAGGKPVEEEADATL